jgi:hypothetical protein
MLTSNPKIDGSQTSVPTLIANLPKTKPVKYTIKGTIKLPSWFGFEYHLQGVAPYNGGAATDTINGCISASSSAGYFLDFTQSASSLPQVVAVVTPDPNYYHAAGIQMLGDVLAVPLESKDSKYAAKVAFYNVERLPAPAFLYSQTMPVQPSGSKAAKASATAVTTYTDASGIEQALLAVYQYDPRNLYFYRAPASQLGNASSPWVNFATYTGKALDGDQFQSFAMVTETRPGSADLIYLMGFREDEELHLFKVDAAVSSVNVTPLNVYTGWKGSDWRNGVGLQICSSTRLRIFGTAKDPSGDSDDYTIDMYVWQ